MKTRHVRFDAIFLRNGGSIQNGKDPFFVTCQKERFAQRNTLVCPRCCHPAMLMKYLTMNSLLLALMFATLAFAFVPQRNVAFRASTFLQKTPEDFKSDFPPEESYEGDIDWDAEWKKVVSNKDQPRERPGKDFCKYRLYYAVFIVSVTARVLGSR